MRSRLPFLNLALAAMLATTTSGQSQVTWTGGGSDDLWGTGANWLGGAAPGPSTTTDLLFAGNIRLTPQANYGAFDDFRNITFDSGAGAFVVSGNAIDLFGKIENNSAITQTFNLTIGTGSASGGFIEINPTQGDLNIGGTDVFLGNNQLRVWGNNGKTLTFGTGTIISGAGGSLAINQNSTVVFQSAHTYTGGTFVNAGTLRLASGGSANSSTINLLDTTGTVNAAMELAPLSGGLSLTNPIVVRSGSTGVATLRALNTSGTHTLTGGFTLNRGLTVSASPGGNLDLTGVIGGSGALTKEGGGNLKLTNNGNSYTGGTVVNGGTLTLEGANTGIGVVKGTLTVNSGGSVIAASGNALGWQGGANQVTVLNINDGTFTSTANGDQGWGLTVNMTGGTLSSSGTGAHFSVGNNWTINTLASANTATIAGQLNTREGNANNSILFTVADGAATNDLAVTANIIAQTTGVGITKAGPGTMTLSGANSYSGATIINSGKLIAASSSALGTNATAVTVNSGSTLSWAANGYNSFPSRAINIIGGTVSLDSATNNAHNYINQTLTMQGGTLTSVNGVGGTANDGGFGNLILNGSTVAISGTTQSTISVSTMATTGAANFNVGVTGSPVDLLIPSQIIGAGALVKNGLGTLQLTNNANSFSGGTTVNAGTLSLNGANSGVGIIKGTLTVNDGATVIGVSGNALGWLGGANQVTVVNLVGGTFDNASNSDGSWGQTFNLTGGTMRSNGGVSSLVSNSVLSFGAGLAVNTLASPNSSTVAGAVTLRQATTVFTVADGAAAVDLVASAGMRAQVGGSGITKAGLGVMSLSGANNYDGTTTITGGTLQLNGSGSINDAAAVNLTSSGTVFEIAGITTASEKIGALSAAVGSTLKLGAKTLEFGDATNTSFAGTIDSTSGGGITKAGSGTLTLEATTSITASPNINLVSGTLLTASSNLIPDTTALTLSGGTLSTTGFSDTIGTLRVNSNSIIDLGAGTSVLTFADSSSLAWSGLLSIWNWSGSTLGGGTEQLNFLSGGLTPAQLSSIQFVDPAGFPTGSYGAKFIGNELVPVPEPSALWIAGILSTVAMTLGRRSMKNHSDHRMR